MNTGPDFGGLCWICHFGNHFAFSSVAAGEPWESTEQQSVQNRLFGLIVWKVKVSIGKDSFSNLFLKLRNRIPASKCLWNRYYLLIKWNRRNYIKFMPVSNPWSILLLNLLIWSKSNFYWPWFSIGKKICQKVYPRNLNDSSGVYFWKSNTPGLGLSEHPQRLIDYNFAVFSNTDMYYTSLEKSKQRYLNIRGIGGDIAFRICQVLLKWACLLHQTCSLKFHMRPNVSNTFNRPLLRV